MAEKTIEELANDRSGIGTNPGGIAESILSATGGSGGAGVGLAFDPYTSPYLAPRRIFFTINTYTNLSRTDVLAKAYLDGIEIEDQSNTKGRITFSLPEQRFLNPSTLTLVSGDLKPQKYFIIQARKDVENEVSIIEYDIIGDRTPSALLGTPTPTGEGLSNGSQDTSGGQFDGSGGVVTRGAGGGAGSVVERDFGTGFGREVVVGADLLDRQNIQ